MPASDTDIVNGALALLGVQPISAIGEDSVPGGLAQNTYETIRDELLASHPWGFATKRVQLAELTPPDEGTGYTRRLQVPDDYLRIVEVIDQQDDAWSVEGRELWTDIDGEIWVRYIRRVTAPGLFSMPFVDALEHQLAARWAETLTKSAELAKKVETKADMKLRTGRSFDGQEGSVKIIEVHGWVNER
jgi:hypothetical protein